MTFLLMQVLRVGRFSTTQEPPKFKYPLVSERICWFMPSSRLLLGCIADDFTGATDLANNLVRSGMRVAQLNGQPTDEFTSSVDAVVIALKTRTLPVQSAIEHSLAALEWLQSQGATQIYFKYCSTFDSTAHGNIGPVIEALMQALKTDFTIATPAFPDNARTVFKGHLFVGDVLLQESSMRNHPLTPMTDANLVRVLQTQCTGHVGLIDYRTIMQGSDAITEKIRQLRENGIRIAIVDAISNEDLMQLAPALRDMPLITAGSGVAIGLAANHGITPSSRASALPKATGLKAVVSGSCSLATQRQVQHFLSAGLPGFPIDAMRLAQGSDLVCDALHWAEQQSKASPVLIYSTASAETISQVQANLGVHDAGNMVEQALARITQGLLGQGVRQLIVAGGETAGACVQALAVQQMQIGPQIDPGVPWCHAYSSFATDGGLHLTLKSGNFGSDDFFSKAFKLLTTSVG